MNMKLLKRFLSLALALCLVAALAACGGSGSSSTPAASSGSASQPATSTPAGEGKTVSFALWDEVQYPVFQEICAKFTEETGINVDLQLTPWSEYWTKLDAAAGAGKAADVFWMNIFLPKYADAGIIEPVESYFVRDGLDKADWSEPMVNLYTYQDQLYCMPKGMDVVVVAYNKAIFDKYEVEYPQEGWTWDDMEAIGAQLRDAIAAQSGTEYAMLMELDSQPSYMQFVLQDGVEPLFSADNKCGYGDPRAQSAFNDIISLMDTGIMPSFTVLSDTKGTDLFLSEKGAMLYVGSWKSVVLDDASFADNIGLVPMPKRSVSNVCGLGGISYAMNANAADKDAAWELIKYLGGEESNKMQAEGRIEIPAYLAAQQYYAPAFQHIDPTAFIEQGQSSTTYPSHPKLAEWQGVETDYTTAIFSKATPVDVGLQEMSAAIEEIMAS